MKKTILLILFFTLSLAQHFNLNISETGESTLFIFQNSILNLEFGDEVALFDIDGIIDDTGATGEILVGAGVWTGEQLEVTAIGAVDLSDFMGPILPGYDGGTMTLKVWDVCDQSEYDATYTTTFGSGSFNGLFSNIDSITFNNGASDGSAELDCAGVCGGDSVLSGCGECVSPDEACLCESEIYDCFGICDGEAVLDDCGVCDGANQDQDCAGICVGSMQILGASNLPYTIISASDNPDTDEIDGFTENNQIQVHFWDISSQLELSNINIDILSGNSLFTSLGYNTMNLSTQILFGCTDQLACNYDPDATLADDDSCWYYEDNGWCDCFENLFDECGICAGNNDSIDECGVCDGDNSSCSGCMDETAPNYDESAILDDGSCEYPQQGDINNDSILDVIDLVLLINLILDDVEYIPYADLNNDGIMNVIDIVILVNWIIFGNPCGDEVCNSEEDYFSCPDDCPPPWDCAVEAPYYDECYEFVIEIDWYCCDVNWDAVCEQAYQECLD
jgi:hypothetical protein